MAATGLALDPDHPGLLCRAAEAALASGHPAEALAPARRLLALQPRHSWAAHLLASGFDAMGEGAAAVAAWRLALTHNPDNHRALAGLSRRRLADGAAAEALALAWRLVALVPGEAAAWHLLGRAAAAAGAPAEAEPALARAAALAPGDGAPLTDLGVVLRRQGRLAEAEAAHRAALAREPGRAEARWNLANVLLARGDYPDGFALAEARFARPGAPSLPDLPGAPWDGRTLRDGASLLLAAEQGVGDLLQMLRFAGRLAARGLRVVVQCRAEVAALAATAPGVAAVVPLDVPPPACDAWLPVMSLPHRLGLRLEDLPDTAFPYLAVPPAVPPPPLPPLTAGRRRVGLVWRGNPAFADDATRSLRLADLAPLAAGLAAGGWEVVLLQPVDNREPGWATAAASLAPGPAACADPGGWLRDYGHTAAVLARLDLLIACDTAALHLAGALGRPAWALLPFAADWRWGVEGTTSRWYPSLRLFRQPAPGAWDAVAAAVADALADALARVDIPECL